MAGKAFGDVAAVELQIEGKRAGGLLGHQRTGAQSLEVGGGQR
jgi:hypothetical protein